jgi:hypothetical protein
MAESQERWYPTINQLGDAPSLERAFREVLRLHYQTVDQLNELRSSMKTPTGGGAGPGAAVNTAAITNLLGLPVQPSDTTTLADGATLKYVKATRSFKFS